MKIMQLPCTSEAFLKHLRFATEIDTVEKNQIGAKDAVFYSHVQENSFELYERPAFTREKTFSFGGVYIRGAVVDDAPGCQLAIEFGRSTDNIKTVLIALVLFLLSLGLTVLSGNIFATMFPILVLISGGFLIADAFQALLQAKRLKKKWAQICDAVYNREEVG